jgi:hypothetical protein
MATNKHEHKTAIFEDGTHAVLRFDPADPLRLELIAIFYEGAHAKDYVHLHAPAKEHQQKQPAVKPAAKHAPKRKAMAKPAPASKAATKQVPAAAPKLVSEAKPKRAPRAQSKKPASAARTVSGSGVSERQAAVLKGLRSLMDKQHRVEAKTAELAKASSVPLGSLHSILVSLEKKHMIKTERQGSPKHPAVYQVLESSRKAAGTLNGAVHGGAAPAQATR